MKPSRRPLADYVRDCKQKRAARLIFLIQPIKSWICGVVVVVAVVISLTPHMQCVFNTASFPKIHPFTMPTPYCDGSVSSCRVSCCISYQYVPQRRQNDLKMALILETTGSEERMRKLQKYSVLRHIANTTWKK